MVSLSIFRNPKLFPFWVTLGIGMIVVLGHFGAFPVTASVVTVLFFLFIFWAFWKPRAVIGVFFATIILEYIPLVSVGGVDLRWYQVVAVSLGLGLLARFFAGRESIRAYLISLKWFDAVVGGLFVISMISALVNGGVAIKQSIVLLSFIALYFLARYCVRSRKDVSEFLPFLIGPFLVVSLFAVAQNILFLSGGVSGEVMMGRPNSTFTEADWLGVYAGVGVVLASIFVLATISSESRVTRRQISLKFLSHEMLILGWVVLILTVARSAWLATVVALGIVGAVLLWRKMFQDAFYWGRSVMFTSILSVCIVFGLHLTSFELGNRIQSIGSGLQEITIACQGGVDTVIPQVIEGTEDLRQNGCQQIDLEEIGEYENRGYIVQKIFRKDPTVEIRKNTWATALQEIQKHPILGIGWGNIGNILGTDENGASLNSSNIFLEFWLGLGVFGFVGILCLFGYALFSGVRSSLDENIREQLFGLAILGIGTVFLVANLFNAGHFLAVFWIWLAMTLPYSLKTNRREI